MWLESTIHSPEPLPASMKAAGTCHDHHAYTCAHTRARARTHTHTHMKRTQAGTHDAHTKHARTRTERETNRPILACCASGTHLGVAAGTWQALLPNVGRPLASNVPHVSISSGHPIECNGARGRHRCGRGKPSPGADVAAVSQVPVQMWHGCGVVGGDGRLSF